MKYWLFNAENIDDVDGDATAIWFQHKMEFSGGDRKKYGDPLRKMEVGDFVLMYQARKGYVGIGEVLKPWNEREYKQKLVYKDFDFPEYRIAIDWKYDLRETPFEIGWTSPRFLCSVAKPELVARIEEVIRCASKGHPPRPIAEEAEEYIPTDDDERELIRQQIRQRRGQRRFRNRLRDRYGSCCQITRCSIFDIVEAAHIRPYRSENDNDGGNGLLLRADIHTLFDLDLIGIHPDSLAIHLAETIRHEYAKQVRRKLFCRNNKRPSRAALEWRYRKFCELR